MPNNLPPPPPLLPEGRADAHRPDARTLPPEWLAQFVSQGTPRSYARGTVVVAEGEPALSMYVIHEGQLRVFVADEAGREVELNVLGPGEYFGELMLDGQTRSASVITLTAARLTMIARPQFEQLLVQRPDLAFHVIQHLIQRVRMLSRHVQGLASMDVYGRVAQLFGELVREEGGIRFVPGPLSQQKIAGKVGASRSMINRILKDLTEGGYITASRDRIVLHKPLPKHW